LLVWTGIGFGVAWWFDVVVAFAVGAGDVPDEWRVVVLRIGVKLVLDGGQGAEQEIAGVGERGCAARSNAILCEELEESGEEFIDVGGGGEFFGAGSEDIREIDDGSGGWLKMLVIAAEKRGSWGERKAATASSGEEMAAAG
jgi:hypothetical protein